VCTPKLLANNNQLVLIGVRRNDFLEVGTRIEVDYNGLLGEGEI